MVSTWIVGRFHCTSSYLHCPTKKKLLVCMHIHDISWGSLPAFCSEVAFTAFVLGRSGSPGLLVRHDNVEIVLDILVSFKW
jgi:hypothetical protein